MEDEGEGEGAPQKFQEMDGTGLGEGDGKKDVSDRIESEDQLEAALKEGEEEEKGDTDLKEEEKGIEMGDDFEGKMQDVEREEKEDDDGDESGEDENGDEHDKQMGETEKGADKLDEKLWGEDDEEKEDENEGEEEGNKEDEDGPGDGEQSESQMVAKDDNKSKQEDSKEREKKKKPEEMEEDTREFPEEKEEEGEYDDNFTDQNGGEDGEQQEQNEDTPMDLPDDLNLDGGEEHNDEGEDENEEESDPMDIEDKGLFPEEEREKREKEEGKMDDEEDEDADDQGEDKTNENRNDEESEDEEGGKKDDRKVGTEEDDGKKDEEEDSEKTEGCEDQQNRNEVEAALDTTEGSKDQTKEQPKDDTAQERKEDKEEMQEEMGEVGEQTEDMSGVGESESRTQDDAHKGESTALVTEKNAQDQQDMRKPRKPGEANEERSLGNEEEITRGLMTKDSKSKENKDKSNEESEKDSNKKQSDTYEHIKHAQESFDAQTVDSATQEQAAERPAPADHGDEDDNKDEEMGETPMEVDEEPDVESTLEKEALHQENVHGSENKKQQQGLQEAQEGETRMDTEGDAVLEALAQRPPESFFHTLLDLEDPSLITDSSASMFNADVEGTRARLMRAEITTEAGASSWSQHEERVAPLALQLCEQLRLILEPTQAARLRGDYRTGKRLNMRKVIPYIASQFRKDKIWLRRTQPNKRTYQILLAVDDSESMAVMQAGGLASESVALVTKALTLLEVGQVGVVSFGETTQILHPLDQPFSEASGATVLSNLTFKQKESKFGRMLEDSVALLTASRTNSSHGNRETAQLLLILSDGQTHARSAAVRAAVRAARAQKIFIVFLVLDTTDNEYSFYDVLVWEDGAMKPLVETFPFPFFVVVRDLDNLPDTLATALRQWFELVTADQQ